MRNEVCLNSDYLGNSLAWMSLDGGTDDTAVSFPGERQQDSRQ